MATAAPITTGISKAIRQIEEEISSETPEPLCNLAHWSCMCVCVCVCVCMCVCVCVCVCVASGLRSGWHCPDVSRTKRWRTLAWELRMLLTYRTLKGLIPEAYDHQIKNVCDQTSPDHRVPGIERFPAGAALVQYWPWLKWFKSGADVELTTPSPSTRNCGEKFPIVCVRWFNKLSSVLYPALAEPAVRHGGSYCHRQSSDRRSSIKCCRASLG